MPASVWVYQDWRQVQEKGEAKASWFVGWYNLEGKRRSKSFGAGSFGKMKANKYRAKMEEELNGGLYQELLKKTWQDFRREYEEKILEALAPRTRDEAISALVHFERIIKPVRMGAITARSIDQYAAKRRKEPGKKKGDMVSPATVNKELRHIKAALRLAFEWSYLAQLPRVRMQKAPTKLATYVTGEHFAAIYQACDKATFPEDQRYEPADWWRGLIVMGYMTGWRISDMLGLRREDLDLDSAFAITRARDNKAKRDERVKLHPVVVDHLRRLVGFERPGVSLEQKPSHPGYRVCMGPTERWHPSRLPGATRAHTELPRLRVPRPTACLCHDERRQADPGHPAGPDAAQELPDHTGVHQHGPSNGRGRCRPARARRSQR